MIFLALFVAFSFQGTRGIYETTEGRYAECAREMVETGNYLAPTLSYRPHWSKPPLAYWIIAGERIFARSWIVSTFAISGRLDLMGNYIG